jgi:hypothetical protein
MSNIKKEEEKLEEKMQEEEEKPTKEKIQEEKEKLINNLANNAISTTEKANSIFNLLSNIDEYNKTVPLEEKLITTNDTVYIIDKDILGCKKDKFKIVTNRKESISSIMGTARNSFIQHSMSSIVRKIYIEDSKALAVIGEKPDPKANIIYNRYHINPTTHNPEPDGTYTLKILSVERNDADKFVASSKTFHKGLNHSYH